MVSRCGDLFLYFSRTFHDSAVNFPGPYELSQTFSCFAAIFPDSLASFLSFAITFSPLRYFFHLGEDFFRIHCDFSRLGGIFFGFAATCFGFAATSFCLVSDFFFLCGEFNLLPKCEYGETATFIHYELSLNFRIQIVLKILYSSITIFPKWCISQDPDP